MSFEEIWQKILIFLENAGWKVLELLAVLVFGILLIRLVLKVLKIIFFKSPMDNVIGSFIISILRFILYIALAFAIATILEIPLTSFVAIVSALGLAAGLALQSSLSNLANGMVIIGTKPFKEGDVVDLFISSGLVTGKIKAIKMLTCELLTFDNKKIIVPNSLITSGTVVNYSAKPNRRVDLNFSVAYDSDIDEVIATIKNVLTNHKQVLKSPEPFVRLSEHGTSSLSFVARAWVLTPNYWDVSFDVTEQVFRAFKQKGIVIPYNQLDVHVKSADNPGDGKRIPTYDMDSMLNPDSNKRHNSTTSCKNVDTQLNPEDHKNTTDKEESE